MTITPIPFSDNAIPTLRVVYKNHRGEISERLISLDALFFGTTRWHPEPQWFLRAWDFDKKAQRDFAMRGFISVEAAS